MVLPLDYHLVRLIYGGIKIKLPWPHSADKQIQQFLIGAQKLELYQLPYFSDPEEHPHFGSSLCRGI